MRFNIDTALKDALEKQGVSAAELARRLGVSKPYISKLTTGKGGATEEQLQQIAQAIGCDVIIRVAFVPKP